MSGVSEKIKCHNCGLPVPNGGFCPMCGSALAAGGAAVASPMDDCPTVAAPMVAAPMVAAPTVAAPTICPPQVPHPHAPGFAPSVPAVAGERIPEGELRLEGDQLCVLFEDVQGVIRLRLRTAPGGCFDEVTLTVRDKVAGTERKVCANRCIAGMREFVVPVSPKRAGTVVWDVLLEYVFEGRRLRMEGEWATVVVGRDNVRSCVENLVVNINTNITTGHASEVHNSQDAANKLSEALAGSGGGVFESLKAVVLGDDRAYRCVDLYACRRDGALPPMPPEAACDRMVLDLGIWRVTLFSGRTVTFGRSRELNDIALRPPEGGDTVPYRMISRRHCRFAHVGTEVVIADGARDEVGVVHPSSCGTFFDGERLRDEVRLSATGTGSGRLTFSGAGGTGVVSMEVRVLTAGELCASCPRSERVGCQGGARPSLLMKRTDGIPECFVAVWSCVRLEDVDPSYVGVKVFREGSGFAWRRGRRCGWLVPGMKADDLVV